MPGHTPRRQELRQLVAHLRRGGVIAYPTEGVWGLGCDPRQRQALRRILHLKKRPQHKGVLLIAGLGVTEKDAVKVFHAGTQSVDGHVATAGGRVLGVTALGDSLAIAQHRAYSVVAKIHWSGVQFRQDIGHLGLRRD